MSVPTSRDMSPPGSQLTSLADDDEDIATRVDQPLAEQELARAMAPMPVPNLQGHPQPQIHMAPNGARAGSELNVTIPQQNQQQPGASPWAAAHQLPPAFAAAQYANNNSAPTVPTTRPSGLPAWTLAIPAALIAIAAVVLAVRLLKQAPEDTPKPQPTTTVSAAASTPATPTVTAPTVTAPTVDTSTVPTIDLSTSATASKPTVAPPTATPVTTSSPAPVNTTPKPVITTPKPPVTGTVRKKPVLDNPDFGGRR